ncbi:MAG: DnaJ domain-containing protein, partial [Candidatus Hadarchaeales archaeon]
MPVREGNSMEDLRYFLETLANAYLTCNARKKPLDRFVFTVTMSPEFINAFKKLSSRSEKDHTSFFKALHEVCNLKGLSLADFARGLRIAGRALGVQIPGERDYYEILGVRQDATEHEIRTAYRSLIKKFHPDTAEEEHENALKNLTDIRTAYRVLSDPLARAVYNKTKGEISDRFYPSLAVTQDLHITAPRGKEKKPRTKRKAVRLLVSLVLISSILTATGILVEGIHRDLQLSKMLAEKEDILKKWTDIERKYQVPTLFSESTESPILITHKTVNIKPENSTVKV